jgi:GR25 family glycosyltransferase involved in LPS biosynthesis
MFKKIYYINLDRRPDRNEHIKKELKKINKDKEVERIPAIDGRTLNIAGLSNELITDEGKLDALNINGGMYYILTPGAVGCALSHLNIYNKIIDELNDNEYALIVEDDIIIQDNFDEKLNNYINKIPKFDILFIGYHYYTNDDPTRKIFDDYGEPTKIFGLFGYIINVKAALTIKKVFPLRYQIDTEMPNIFKDLNVFYLKEKLIFSLTIENLTSFVKVFHFSTKNFFVSFSIGQKILSSKIEYKVSIYYNYIC